jgi:hypothetical protein
MLKFSEFLRGERRGVHPINLQDLVSFDYDTWALPPLDVDECLFGGVPTAI